MSNTSYGSYTVTNISSITDITNYYLATSASSGVDINNPNWSTDPTTQVMDETKQYLWTYEKTFLGDGSVLNTTTPIIIGRYGKDGGTGKGISSIVEWYQTSSNNVTAPATPTAAGTGYSSSPVATTTDKPYLWNYEVVNYTSGNPYISDARVIGTHGQTGKDGSSGVNYFGNGLPYMDVITASNHSTSYPFYTSNYMTARTPSGSEYVKQYADFVEGEYIQHTFYSGRASATEYRSTLIKPEYWTGEYRGMCPLLKNLQVGDTVTISGEFWADDVVVIGFSIVAYATSSSGVSLIRANDTLTQLTPNTWTLVSGTGTVTQEFYDQLKVDTPYNLGIQIRTATVPNVTVTNRDVIARTRRLKLERGAEATSWLPAPEDEYAVNVFLSNDNHTFVGNESSAIASSIECAVTAYKGNTQIWTNVGTITNIPSGMSVTVNNNNKLNTTIAIEVNNTMTTKNGILTIPITVDGKTFNKIFTYSLALKGEDGQMLYATCNTSAGTAAKVATLTSGTVSNPPEAGTTVAVTFTNANTASSPTLKIGNSTAIAIKSYMGSNLTESEYKWSADACIIFVYDNNQWRMMDSGSLQAASKAMTTANGKNAVFHQDSQPASTSNYTLQKGDTWFDTDDGYKMYQWSGSSWVAEQYGTNAIADVAITSAKIGDLAVTNAKIADATIESGKIKALDVGKLTGGYISADHLTATNIKAGTLSAERIQAGSIEYVKLSKDAKQEIKDSSENMLFDVYVPSLTAVDGPSDRYLSDATYSQTTGEFIAEDNLPDSKSTHFYRITYGNGARGLAWYAGNYVPFQNGEKYRIGCYARGTGTAKISPRLGAYGYNYIGYSVTSEWKWYEIVVDFRDTGSTNGTYKRVYYNIFGASGDTLDMCGWRVTRLSDYQGNEDNLLLESNVQKSNSNYNIASYYFGGDKPKHGDIVTLTIKGTLGDKKTGWGIYNSGGQVGCFEVGCPLSNLWYDSSDGTYKATFIWKEYNPTGTQVGNNTHLNIYAAPNTVTGVTSTIEWIKLERGSVATPWCLNNIERTNGGRNLLLGSKDFSSESGNNQTGITKTTDTYQSLNILKGVWSSGNMDMGRFENKFSVALEPNTDYTLSFWAKADTAMTAVSYLFTPSTIVSGYNSSGNTTTSTDGAISTNITTTWKRHWITWHTSTATSQATSLIVARRSAAGTIYIAGVKFEKGATPTDWTPAPEDVDNAIENITVSGRNLLKDSEKIGSSWVIQNGSNSNGTVTLTRTTAETRIYQMPANGYWTWEPSTEYVASIEAKGNAGGELLQFACNGGGTVKYNNTNPTITTSWKRYSMSFVTGTPVSTGSMSFLNGTNNSTIQVRKPKLEKGNKATDWSPAPEDMSEAIEKAQSSADGKNTVFYNTEDNVPDGIKVGDTWFVQGYLNLFGELYKLPNSWISSDGTVTITNNKNGTYTMTGSASTANRWIVPNISMISGGVSNDNNDRFEGMKRLSNGTYLMSLGSGVSGIRIGVVRYTTAGSGTGASATTANATSGKLDITINDSYAYNCVGVWIAANTTPNVTFTPSIYRTSDSYTTIEVKQWDGDSWEPTTYGDECFSRIDAGTITTGELRTIQLKGPNEDTYWDLSTGEWQSHGRKEVTYWYKDTSTGTNTQGNWQIETDVNINDGVYEVTGSHDNKNTKYATFGIKSQTFNPEEDYTFDEPEAYAYAGLELRGDNVTGKAWDAETSGVRPSAQTETTVAYTPFGMIGPDNLVLGGCEEDLQSDKLYPDRNKITVKAGTMSTVLSSMQYDENYEVYFVGDGTMARRPVMRNYYVPWAIDLSDQLVEYTTSESSPFQRCQIQTGRMIVQGKVCTISLAIDSNIARGTGDSAYIFVKLDDWTNDKSFRVAPITGYAPLMGYFTASGTSTTRNFIAYVEKISARNFTNLCVVFPYYKLTDNDTIYISGSYIIDKFDPEID